jgi:hypothetical protein
MKLWLAVALLVVILAAIGLWRHPENPLVIGGHMVAPDCGLSTQPPCPH